jgi:tyrosine-protein kinase Etk/Wzc
MHPTQELNSTSAHSASGPDTPVGGTSREISLIELLALLGRQKFFIAKYAFAFAAFAALISFILPVRYKATTTMLPPQQGSSISSAVLSQLGSLGSLASMSGGGALGLKNPSDLHVAMLHSRTVEDALIKRFELQTYYGSKRLSDTRKNFESDCLIEAGQKDGLIRISVDNKDPKRAAEIANAYVEEYNRLTAGLAITEASQRRLFFEQQLVSAKNNLANAEEELKKTEMKTGLIQLDSQARALIESIAILRAQIAAKEVQIQTLSSYATGGNPELQIARQELSGLRVQLKRLGGSESEQGDLIVPSGKVPQAGLEYVRKLRDVKYHETIFELLARQFEMAKLDEAKEGVLVQVVDAAVVPDRKSSPKRGLITIVAFFLGLIGAIVWVLLEESMKSAREEPARSRLLQELFDAWKPPKSL